MRTADRPCLLRVLRPSPCNMATSVRSERARRSIKRVDYLNLLRGADVSESEEDSESSGEELGESESGNSDTETENNESSSDSDPQHSRQKSNVNRLPCASSSRTSAAHRKRIRPDNLTDRYVYLKTSISFKKLSQKFEHFIWNNIVDISLTEF